ncbi:MAG: pilus assembly protein [Dissulfurimicrobium hydrothermale]|uniref:pilus assembly protein n=1 Tax=Dissulfurimicrobium hydrothermale TaxID=1750598 RepID=UPI003C7612F9
MKGFSGTICWLVVFLGLSGPLFTGALSYAAMNDYCQAPPFVTEAVQPNVMLTVDVSGSMSWCAYNPNSSKSNCCTSSSGCGWTYQGTEEGYFTPDKKYMYDSSNNYWVETTDSTALTKCPKNTTGISTSSSKRYMGSCLNYHLMHRIDLVRWAMTGGNPASCTGNKTFDKNQCDPELWQQPGNSGKVGSVCNNTIGGCILLADDGVTQVKVPWSRVYGGLVFQFENMSLRPRIGAMFFSNSGIRSKGKVYIGDFTAPNSTSTQFPYMNLITSINSSAPSGGTPTGPAMWDTLNYFSQTAPQYGGLAPQSGSGDRWKDPMYVCDGGGTNCSLVPCAKNFTILMSDGQWNTPGCSGSPSDPVMPAYQMHEGFTNLATNIQTNVNAVYAIGLFLGGTGKTALKNVAMYGSFNTAGRTWPDSLAGYPQGACYMDDCGSGKGSGCTPLPASSPDWDANGDGIPDTFYNASDAQGIKDTIMNAILDILRRASSGTAVSVLSSSEGSGANLIQALFYPKRTFGQTEISWISDLMNYWYYMDPYFTYSQIREDTVREGDTASPPYTLLDLKNDYIANFYFDNSQQKTMESRCQDTDGNGSCDTNIDTVPIEDAKAIWRAGFNLWWTNPSSRWIKTWVDKNTGIIPFSTSNSSTLAPYLMAGSDPAAKKIINYIRGYDQVCASTGLACSGCSDCTAIGRNRTVSIDINNNGTIDTGETNVWKLGDIINSTPRIMGPSPLNNYHLPAPSGYNDQTYSDFVNSNDYANRGRVFVGANDGMLHAFRLGTLAQTWTTPAQQQWQKAMLTGGTGTGGIGAEIWAFIPKNVLPYLQYLSNPNYCHFYMVDGPITLVDASINKPSTCSQANYWDCPKITTQAGGNLDLTNTSWSTVVMGSMGFGGASVKKTCNGIANGTPCDVDTDCQGNQTCQNPDPGYKVGVPLLDSSGNPIGVSSYFALDVTDQDNPNFLWEFTDPGLGFTNVGPAIVRVGDRTKNGRWFAVIASGPTGPIDTGSHEFKAVSDQNLKLFILDMKTGALLRTIDTGITNAFAGSLQNATIDLERNDTNNAGNYSDDAVYVGYTQCTANCNTSNPTWGGGVLRLIMNDNPDPSQWTVSKVIDGIGPVTSSIAKLLDRKNGLLWLYFGEGRYFYKTDDLTTQRKLYGIQEPCYINSDIALSCNTAFDKTTLQDQTGSITTTNGDLPSGKTGWFINLDPANSNFGAERVISNPTSITNGAVFFLTFAPSADICGYGGSTYLWTIDYKTGGSVGYALQGKVMIQVSTGEIKELDLSNKTGTFPNSSNRKSNAILGVPPTGQGLMVVTNPLPIKKVIHVQEK